jgi:hypothetical protein
LKNKKLSILILALTLLPLGYILYFIAFVATGRMMLSHEGFRFIFKLHMAVIIYTWVLTGFYITYLLKTDKVTAEKKALWAVVLFLGNMMTMPVFWYLYIWKSSEERISSTPVD